MTAYLLAAATLVAVPEVEVVPSPTAAAKLLADDVQTGTLLFSEGDCLAIRVFTGSPYTHVAAVVVRDGEPYVYDSMNGDGVRVQTLKRYLASQTPDEVHVLQPAEPFSPETAEKFRRHLDEQLGRPYAVKHHVTGQRSEGLHCAEYVTDALIAGEVMKARRPPRVSPASLRSGALKSELFVATKTVQVTPPVEPPPKADNWCSQLWLDTKLCTMRCCTKMKGWFLCR